MGFRIFCFFPNFNPVNLCRMTVPGEFLSAVIGERKIPIFLFAPLAVPQCPSRAWIPNESPCTGCLLPFLRFHFSSGKSQGPRHPVRRKHRLRLRRVPLRGQGRYVLRLRAAAGNQKRGLKFFKNPVIIVLIACGESVNPAFSTRFLRGNGISGNHRAALCVSPDIPGLRIFLFP